MTKENHNWEWKDAIGEVGSDDVGGLSSVRFFFFWSGSTISTSSDHGLNSQLNQKSHMTQCCVAVIAAYHVVNVFTTPKKFEKKSKNPKYWKILENNIFFFLSTQYKPKYWSPWVITSCIAVLQGKESFSVTLLKWNQSFQQFESLDYGLWGLLVWTWNLW